MCLQLYIYEQSYYGGYGRYSSVSIGILSRAGTEFAGTYFLFLGIVGFMGMTALSAIADDRWMKRTLNIILVSSVLVGFILCFVDYKSYSDATSSTYEHKSSQSRLSRELDVGQGFGTSLFVQIAAAVFIYRVSKSDVTATK